MAIFEDNVEYLEALSILINGLPDLELSCLLYTSFNLVKDPGTLYLDKENNLWINTYSGRLYRYNLITHQAKRYFFGGTEGKPGKRKNIYIDCMMQDRNGRVWMGARKDGLLEYFPQSDSFSSIPRNQHTPGGLDYDGYLTCLFEDRDGNIWIGSDKGLSLIHI